MLVLIFLLFPGFMLSQQWSCNDSRLWSKGISDFLDVLSNYGSESPEAVRMNGVGGLLRCKSCWAL